MSTLLPAICGRCEEIWFADSVFSLGGGGSVKIVNLTLSPCPNCGGEGRVPDGTYRESAFSLSDAADLLRVQEAFAEIIRRVDAGLSVEQAKQEVAARHPWLAKAMAYIPKDAKQLGPWLLLVAALINRSCDPPIQHHEHHGFPEAVCESVKVSIDCLRDSRPHAPAGKPNPDPQQA